MLSFVWLKSFFFFYVLHSLLQCTFTWNNEIVIAHDNDGRISFTGNGFWEEKWIKKLEKRKMTDRIVLVVNDFECASSSLKALLNHSSERVAHKPNGSWPYSRTDSLRIWKIPYCFVCIEIIAVCTRLSRYCAAHRSLPHDESVQRLIHTVYSKWVH